MYLYILIVIVITDGRHTRINEVTTMEQAIAQMRRNLASRSFQSYILLLLCLSDVTRFVGFFRDDQS